MQIILLNDGGYGLASQIDFPVTVEAEYLASNKGVDYYSVPVKALRKFGLCYDLLNDNQHLLFIAGKEAQPI